MVEKRKLFLYFLFFSKLVPRWGQIGQSYLALEVKFSFNCSALLPYNNKRQKKKNAGQTAAGNTIVI